MSRKAVECENCGTEYTIVYDAEDASDEPIHCPFCGEIANADDLEEDLDMGEWDE